MISLRIPAACSQATHSLQTLMLKKAIFCAMPGMGKSYAVKRLNRLKDPFASKYAIDFDLPGQCMTFMMKMHLSQIIEEYLSCPKSNYQYIFTFVNLADLSLVSNDTPIVVFLPQDEEAMRFFAKEVYYRDTHSVFATEYNQKGMQWREDWIKETQHITKCHPNTYVCWVPAGKHISDFIKIK
jgi:hypothetical protein